MNEFNFHIELHADEDTNAYALISQLMNILITSKLKYTALRITEMRNLLGEAKDD